MKQILFLLGVAVARADAATTTLSLDAREGVRTAAAVETVGYDTAWCPAGTKAVGIEADDGSLAFSTSAPAVGTVRWNAGVAAKGIRTLTLKADGVALYTAKFLVPVLPGSATTTLSLDTRTGVRSAKEVEPLVWDAAWCPDGTRVVGISADDGSLAFSMKTPAAGTAEWDTTQAAPGVRTLSLRADGAAFYTAQFEVGASLRTETQTTPEPVPFAWLDGFALGDGSEAGYEAAAWAKAANGTNDVWQCYVAGLDPTNATSRFFAEIDAAVDPPRVTWTPDLNEGGTKGERVYTVEGKASLGDESWGPTNGSTRFFRVKVSLP